MLPVPLRSRLRPWLWPALAYAAVVAALWPVPVFGILHAESSAVVAAAAFFVSAIAGIGALRCGESAGCILVRSVAVLAVPLALLTLSLLWRPNCAYWTGLGLFVLLVPPSAVLGASLAAALVASGVRRARLVAVGTGLAVAAGGTVWTLAVHPQLFVYNPVYGGVLGPIYDDELALRTGLFVARGEALVWAGVLLCWARWRNGGGTRWATGGASGLAVLGIAALLPLGTTQSAAGIESVLSAEETYGSVIVHMAAEATPAARAEALDAAAFRLYQAETRLGVRISQPVHVYLYPDAETKGRLIGSRQTSVVPVWLQTPQVHMLAAEVPRSLGHEMIHVVAREFGMPGLRASPAVGLIEGLAVAAEPPDGLPDPETLVAAALALPGDAGGLDADPAAVVSAAMSPVGFWSGRAAVSYTATGAFTRWLIETHGIADVREAYRTGSVAGATGIPLDTLAARWAAHVRTITPTPEAVQTAVWLFRQPSLFEIPCPHYVPAFVRETRAGVEALDAGDRQAADAAFQRALRDRPDDPSALAGLVAARARNPVGLGFVILAARDTAASVLTLRAAADAARLTGRDRIADALYARTWDRLVPTDRTSRLGIRLRSRLTRAQLSALFGNEADAPRRAASVSPFFAALLWESSGEPARAWAAIQSVPDADLPRAERGALRGLAARLVYRAGALADAERLAALAERDLRGSGAVAAADVVGDFRERIRWRTANRAPRIGVPP